MGTAEMKPHKLVIERIKQSGATAEELCNIGGLKSIQELEGMFTALRYLDLYVVKGSDGVYTLAEGEEEYNKVMEERMSEADKAAKMKEAVRNLNALFKRDPDKLLLDSKKRQVKAFDAYTKMQEKAQEEKFKDHRLTQLKAQLAGLRFSIACEEDRELKTSISEVVNVFDNEIDVETIDSVNDHVITLLAKLESALEGENA